jgi:antitoxin (DNA-binding transcriptional repressor) of toxin-antitoxin stability system
MPVTVTIEEVSAGFDQILARLLTGAEEIIISRAGQPVARLVAITAPSADSEPRLSGVDAGKFVIPPEFYDPLPEDFIDEFYNGPIFP